VNVNLPDDTVEFAAVLGRMFAAETDTSPVAQYHALSALGVLDLASADSADPANAQLNTVVALEECARARCRVPIAETIWARSRALVADGFVAVPSAVDVHERRFIPYGAAATSMVSAGCDGVAKLIDLAGRGSAAHVDADDGHLWVDLPGATSSLSDLDAGYAWRTAAAATVGYMAAATDMAAAHARSREQFGKPIGSFQALQFRLSECQWRLLGLRLLVREAAWRADRRNDPRAEVVSALAWLYARNVGRIVTRHTHQVFGAIGFTRELGLTQLTGAAATSRALLPAGPAVQLVRAARRWEGLDPPSTVLGAFASCPPGTATSAVPPAVSSPPGTATSAVPPAGP
jgi:hypothetical protein